MSISGGDAANGKSARATKSKPEFRFINHDFTVEQQQDLEAYDLETEVTLQDILAAIANGYDFKGAADAKGGGFRAHLIDARPDSPHYMRCLSGRGSTPFNAIASLFYRHLVLAQEDWSFFAEGGSGPPKFG